MIALGGVMDIWAEFPEVWRIRLENGGISEVSLP